MIFVLMPSNSLKIVKSLKKHLSGIGKEVYFSLYIWKGIEAKSDLTLCKNMPSFSE